MKKLANAPPVGALLSGGVEPIFLTPETRELWIAEVKKREQRRTNK